MNLAEFLRSPERRQVDKYLTVIVLRHKIAIGEAEDFVQETYASAVAREQHDPWNPETEKITYRLGGILSGIIANYVRGKKRRPLHELPEGSEGVSKAPGADELLGDEEMVALVCKLAADETKENLTVPLLHLMRAGYKSHPQMATALKVGAEKLPAIQQRLRRRAKAVAKALLKDGV